MCINIAEINKFGKKMAFWCCKKENKLFEKGLN